MVGIRGWRTNQKLKIKKQNDKLKFKIIRPRISQIARILFSREKAQRKINRGGRREIQKLYSHELTRRDTNLFSVSFAFRLTPDLRPWQTLLVKRALSQIFAFAHKANGTGLFEADWKMRF